MNYKQIYAKRKANEGRILKHFPEVMDDSGIYVLTREENGFRYAYIGQAKNVLKRLGEHLSGYQHIDLSLKKHGLFSGTNSTGWKVEEVYYCGISEIDEAEQAYIKDFHNRGHQLLNCTNGGQGKGKKQIAEFKPSKGYHDGLKQGYKNAQKEVAKWFKKSLEANIQGKPNKNKEKAMEKFKEFLEVENET